jgi:hypothetical protein
MLGILGNGRHRRARRGLIAAVLAAAMASVSATPALAVTPAGYGMVVLEITAVAHTGSECWWLGDSVGYAGTAAGLIDRGGSRKAQFVGTVRGCVPMDGAGIDGAGICPSGGFHFTFTGVNPVNALSGVIGQFSPIEVEITQAVGNFHGTEALGTFVGTGTTGLPCGNLALGGVIAVPINDD